MPAEQAPRPVRVRIGLSAEHRRALDGFAQAMRWPADDAAKILLAYPAAIAEGEGLSQAEVREALGVDVPAEADDPGTAQERLLGFFRRHGRDGGEPGAGGGKAAGGDGKDKERFAKRWPEIRPHIRARWGQLTDRDLERVQGNAEMLIGIARRIERRPAWRDRGCSGSSCRSVSLPPRWPSP